MDRVRPTTATKMNLRRSTYQYSKWEMKVDVPNFGRGLEVPEADARRSRGANHVAVRVHQLDRPDCLLDLAALDLRVHQAHHTSEVAGCDQVNRGHAKARAEDPVER